MFRRITLLTLPLACLALAACDDTTGPEGDELSAFDDIAALAAGCKFADCHHRQEPGCAVRDAVAGGTLPAARLASFHKLAGERKAATVRQEAAQKIAETRRAKGRKPRRRPEDQ